MAVDNHLQRTAWLAKGRRVEPGSSAGPVERPDPAHFLVSSNCFDRDARALLLLEHVYELIAIRAEWTIFVVPEQGHE
ncbi:hypothetical protein, partial [uncultured Arthrobacter sp.]|uniref:hypothetical protein n=1 Tax=uncultured Arthrobacter sp. TaxID=114050 RepID=UPI0025EB7DA6